MTSSPVSALADQQLPVVIVGAGPCGLVTALSLKQYGVPFVIIERASRSKICSNAGSGFELSPTSVEILKRRLGIDVSKIMSYYQGMGMISTEGASIRRVSLPPDYDGGSVNRAEMQKHLLEILFPSSKDEEEVLFCGSGIESYREDNAGRKVVATLTSGDKISGCVLLACDGIHSRCRAVLHGGYDSSQSWEANVQTGNTKDPLHFCKTSVYWGKTPLIKGSELEIEYSKTFPPLERKDNMSRCFFTISLPTKKAPASFFIINGQNNTVLLWDVAIRSESQQKSAANNGKDLTRRGGGPLSEIEKKELFDFTSHGKDSKSIVRGIKNFPLIKKLIEATPAEDITEADLFDRENLDLPFTSNTKLVALLGDAAHPQTPYSGQGVNMAITDAYVYATNIAVALQKKTKSLKEAIADCDSDCRRKSAKKTVKSARLTCDASVSQNRLVMLFGWLYCRFASYNEIMNQMTKADRGNQDYLKYLDEKYCSVKEQETIRQRA